jgi:hypothetical protein
MGVRRRLAHDARPAVRPPVLAREKNALLHRMSVRSGAARGAQTARNVTPPAYRRQQRAGVLRPLSHSGMKMLEQAARRLEVLGQPEYRRCRL